MVPSKRPGTECAAPRAEGKVAFSSTRLAARGAYDFIGMVLMGRAQHREKRNAKEANEIAPPRADGTRTRICFGRCAAVD